MSLSEVATEVRDTLNIHNMWLALREERLEIIDSQASSATCRYCTACYRLLVSLSIGELSAGRASLG